MSIVKESWMRLDERRKKLVIKPYDAIIERVDARSWVLVVREHGEHGVREVKRRPYKKQRLAKADALRTIDERRASAKR